MAASTPRPRIRVREAVPADAPAMVDIHYAAFGPSVMNALMHPGGVTEDARKKFMSSFFPSPDAGDKPEGSEQAPKPGPESISMVAELLRDAEDAPTAAPEIVAFSKWTLHKKERPEEEWNVHKEFTAEMLGEGASVEVVNAFIGGFKALRRKWARGDPHAGMCRNHQAEDNSCETNLLTRLRSAKKVLRSSPAIQITAGWEPGRPCCSMEPSSWTRKASSAISRRPQKVITFIENSVSSPSTCWTST